MAVRNDNEVKLLHDGSEFNIGMGGRKTSQKQTLNQVTIDSTKGTH